MNEIEREFELERMVLFSDAVFAIAITLLVIDIKWPAGTSTGAKMHPVLAESMTLEFAAFVLSFFFVGRAWSMNLGLFRLLRKYDSRLIKHNLTFLFFVVIFPFTASGIAAHWGDYDGLPILLYMANIALVNLMHYRMSVYIFRKRPDLAVRGAGAEKAVILARGKYNAVGLVVIFCTLLVLSRLVPVQIYVNLMAPLYVAHILLLRLLMRKYRTAGDAETGPKAAEPDDTEAGPKAAESPAAAT